MCDTLWGTTQCVTQGPTCKDLGTYENPYVSQYSLARILGHTLERVAWGSIRGNTISPGTPGDTTAETRLEPTSAAEDRLGQQLWVILARMRTINCVLIGPAHSMRVLGTQLWGTYRALRRARLARVPHRGNTLEYTSCNCKGHLPRPTVLSDRSNTAEAITIWRLHLC